MKQPGLILVLIIFVAAVSFVVASEQYKQGRMSTITLTGLNEIPNYGDPDGTGLFKFAINESQNQICYELTTSNIVSPTMAQIHSGGKDTVGPMLVNLVAPTKGMSKDCVSVEPDKLADLIKNQSGFYVSVQNAEFPDGAIRGQLR